MGIPTRSVPNSDPAGRRVADNRLFTEVSLHRHSLLVRRWAGTYRFSSTDGCFRGGGDRPRVCRLGTCSDRVVGDGCGNDRRILECEEASTLAPSNPSEKSKLFVRAEVVPFERQCSGCADHGRSNEVMDFSDVSACCGDCEIVSFVLRDGIDLNPLHPGADRRDRRRSHLVSICSARQRAHTPHAPGCSLCASCGSRSWLKQFGSFHPPASGDPPMWARFEMRIP